MGLEFGRLGLTIYDTSLGWTMLYTLKVQMNQSNQSILSYLQYYLIVFLYTCAKSHKGRYSNISMYTVDPI